MRWERLTDEQVVERRRRGCAEAEEWLLAKYRKIVLFKSRTYFIRGVERDDMIQEGMIGLFKAIRDFRPDHGCSFRTFADVCITRQMLTALKLATGKSELRGQLTLCQSMQLESLDRLAGERDSTICSGRRTPQDVVHGQAGALEALRRLEEVCSPYEWRVVTLFGEGESYAEIDTAIGSPLCGEIDVKRDGIKGADNALCRVRRKLPKVLAMLGEEPGGDG